MGILGNKICKSCRKPKKSLNSDTLCVECQEEINNTVVICENEGCNKKIGIESKNGMCFNCNIEKNICIECGKVSIDGLGDDGICNICKNPPSENNEDKDDISPTSLDDKDNSSSDTLVDKNNLPSKKVNKLIPVSIIVSILFIVGLFLYNLSKSTSDENKIVKNNPIGTKPIIKSKPKTNNPNSFAFVNQNNVNLNETIVSNEVTITGLNNPAEIDVSNGKYSINGNKWSGSRGTINNGAIVKVKHKSNSNYNSISTTVLSIGSINSEFKSRTLSEPIIEPIVKPIAEPINQNNCSPVQRARGEC